MQIHIQRFRFIGIVHVRVVEFKDNLNLFIFTSF